MVKSFEFSRIPKIIFGPGKIKSLTSELLKFGKKILIITGKESFYKIIVAEIIINEIKKEGIDIEHIKVSGEPSPYDIDNIAERYRKQQIDVVVGIGGGSVLDMAKAVSAMLLLDDTVKNHIEGVGEKQHPGCKIPYIAIPTTSGTGSETTNNAVISEISENGFKRSLRHNNFIPDIAIVDPELTLSCPANITAASGMDAFTQLLESYLSNKSSPFTDVLAFEGLKQIKSSLLSVNMVSKKNIDARTNMAYAAMISGITLNNAGLGVVHGFASSIGGYFNIPHGIICGTLMASANKLTIQRLFNEDPQNPAIEKYFKIAKLFVDEEQINKEKYIERFIEKLKVYTDLLKIPKLGKFGIDKSDIELIVNNTSNKNNPYQLSKNDLIKILEDRI